MNFRHDPVILEELEAETTSSGRSYMTPEGNQYPSITTCLSVLSRKSIMEWRKRVGEEEANKISARAAGRGTRVHKMCEDYLNNCLDINKYTPADKQSFLDLQPILDANVGLIKGQELPLYSDYLGVAGRVDCVAEWDGRLSVVDFKTARKKKKKEWISNYFMQASAYCVMFEERTGIPIDKIVILIAVDGEDPQLFVEKRDNYIEDCTRTIIKYKDEQKRFSKL
jgi:hypothetical protein